VAGCECRRSQKKYVSFAVVRKNVHAIGDYANGVVLDTFETALKDVNVTALRPRLEHAQILTKTDMERVGKLGGEYSSFLDESMEVELSLFSYCQHSTYTRVRHIIYLDVSLMTCHMGGTASVICGLRKIVL